MKPSSLRSSLLTSMLLISASTGACLSAVEPIPFATDATTDSSSEAVGDALAEGGYEPGDALEPTEASVEAGTPQETGADSLSEAESDVPSTDGGFDVWLDGDIAESGNDAGLRDATATDTAIPDATLTSRTVYPSDVSILFPLPVAPADLIGANAAGSYGALLPQTSYDKMIFSLGADGGHIERPLDAQQVDSVYGNLRLVSVRLDPCSKRNTASCRTEVRAVLQTVAKLPGGNVVAHDGAVHVFYDVPELELVEMLREILALRNAQSVVGAYPPVNGLGIHPTLEAQGATGPFAVGLRSILLSHIGNARIGRITFFDADLSNDPTWVFKSFDYVSGSPVQVVLPHFDSRGGALEQVVFGSFPFVSASTPGVNGFAIPSSDAPDNVEGVSDLPRPAKGQAANAAVLAAFASAERIQDPDNHNSESIDCSNCHLAEGAVAVGKTHFSLVPAPSQKLKSLDTRYVRQDDAVTNLHAFGYLGRNISVMQRTANESAIVAKQMQTML